jgi:hypothetical protein
MIDRMGEIEYHGIANKSKNGRRANLIAAPYAANAVANRRIYTRKGKEDDERD